MFRIKKQLYVFFLLFIFIFPITARAQSVYHWEEIINTTTVQLESNNDDIILNYTLAVAYANTGEIIKAYDIIDKYGSSVSQDDFNTAVSQYLADWQNYENKNDLLLLNYAAFSEVINANYNEAVKLFEYIYSIDPQNLWALNHAAAALIEVEDYDKAMDYANQALNIQKNEYSHLIRGIIHYENGNYIRALIEAANSRNLFRALIDDEYQDMLD